MISEQFKKEVAGFSEQYISQKMTDEKLWRDNSEEIVKEMELRKENCMRYIKYYQRRLLDITNVLGVARCLSVGSKDDE